MFSVPAEPLVDRLVGRAVGTFERRCASAAGSVGAVGAAAAAVASGHRLPAACAAAAAGPG